MQSLGIFGGTFNPVHTGHLLLAESALTMGHLDRVLWVPNHNPPHRQSSELIAPTHRVEMVRQAIADHPRFTLADIESETAIARYAVDLFHQLQQRYHPDQWAWIVGLDAFKTLPQWYRRDEWVAQCRWLVAPRRADSGSAPEVLSQLNHECHQVANHLGQQGISLIWQPLSMPLVDISSSAIRHACRTGKSIRYRVPESVRLYIQQQALYRPAEAV